MQPLCAPLFVFDVQHFEKSENLRPNTDLCIIKTKTLFANLGRKGKTKNNYSNSLSGTAVHFLKKSFYIKPFILKTRL